MATEANGAAPRPCVKCGSPAFINHAQTSTVFYCDACYAEGIGVKFRSALTRTKLFRNGRNPEQKEVDVLVVVEWDARAQVLASFLHEVINKTNSKKHFKINSKLFLVDTSDSTDLPADCPFEIAGRVHLADALDDDAEVFRTKGFERKENAFEWLLRTAPSRSMKAEFKRLAFDLLLWKLAEQTGVSIVLTSETSDLIAQRTMDLMCFGRSQSVPVLCSTLDQRHPRVSIVRPFRNLTDAELKFVLRAEDEAAVRFASHGDPTTERFVANAMESGFPSTISTVLSVVSKLDNAKLPAAFPQSSGDAPSFCSICLMPRGEENTCELCTNLLQQPPSISQPPAAFELNARKMRSSTASTVLFSLLFLFFSVEGKGIKVRVGHIGAVNVMPKAEAVLEVCRRELWKEGILNDEFDVEILSQMGCGESFEGVAVGADMYHQQNVKVFIGPYCNTELDAVAKMAAFWNIPIIGYMASSTAFSDKTIYKTLARVSLRTTNSLSLATSSLLHHYGWKKVAIVTNTGTAAFDRVAAFEDVFHKGSIQVVRKIMLEETADAKSILASGLLDDLKASARIIVCVFSSTREMTQEFMSAIKTAGMNDHEFVYVLPWLQAEAKDISPWIGTDGQTQQTVKDNFANAVIIDDVNGFDNDLLTPFRERLEANGLAVDQLNLANIYGYIHLYDALKLYAIAATAAINETGELNVTTDGLFLWNKMRRLEFPGLVSAEGISSGTVVMDDLAERAAVYAAESPPPAISRLPPTRPLAAFYVAPNRDEVMKMVEIKPFQVTKCDDLANKSGCMDLAS
ncbi:hypothetical protein M3Y99_01337100 [Aphelenchoides fujianensis]|nr:hypothetical protein M3Y99_01337100 [Aphelenchoides fujianensis]